MIELKQHHLAEAQNLYEEQCFFFPLIAAVLEKKQDGRVFCDREEKPKAFYVEHCFGNAQIFGDVSSDFLASLCDYLLVRKSFQVNKVRLYTPHEPTFLSGLAFDNIRSERQRFLISKPSSIFATEIENFTIRLLKMSDLQLLSEELIKLTRFWRTEKDFYENSHAVIACRGLHPVAICYSAATTNNRAEIDVCTLTKFRRRGLGKAVVSAFVKNCSQIGMVPLWDCFTNNFGSTALAQACGFKPKGSSYSLYTIPG